VAVSGSASVHGARRSEGGGAAATLVAGSLVVLKLLNEMVPVSVFAVNITIALGLGLAIDYSLFLVTRFREELQGGREIPEAVATTAHGGSDRGVLRGDGGGLDVVVAVVPDDRAAELLVCGVEQGGEVAFAEAFRLARAAAMDHHPVDQAAAVAGFKATRPAMEIRPDPLPVTFTTGVRPRAGPRCGPLAGLSVCPASSAKQIHAPSLRATLYRRQLPTPPAGDTFFVAFDGPVDRQLRGPAQAPHEQRDTLEAVPDPERAAMRSTTRANVHRWSPVNPAAVGPACSNCSSWSNCSGLSFRSAARWSAVVGARSSSRARSAE
jgi:hypothetical protein